MKRRKKVPLLTVQLSQRPPPGPAFQPGKKVAPLLLKKKAETRACKIILQFSLKANFNVNRLTN